MYKHPSTRQQPQPKLVVVAVEPQSATSCTVAIVALQQPSAVASYDVAAADVAKASCLGDPSEVAVVVDDVSVVEQVVVDAVVAVLSAASCLVWRTMRLLVAGLWG